MSETAGILVIVVGLIVSAFGLYLLSQTKRQVLGLILIVVGFSVSGTGLLTLESTEVADRPPATSGVVNPDATPDS